MQVVSPGSRIWGFCGVSWSHFKECKSPRGYAQEVCWQQEPSAAPRLLRKSKRPVLDTESGFLQEDWLNERIPFFHWLQARMDMDSCRKHVQIVWHLFVRLF
jgi:hypothetical protein